MNGSRVRNERAHFRLEDEDMADGRYILYYSWPDEADDGHEALAAPGPPPERRTVEPWHPEAGPADDADPAAAGELGGPDEVVHRESESGHA